MPRRLVLVGAGHTHALIMLRMPELRARGISVTVISPHDHQYYSGMGPGMLGGCYRLEELRIPARSLVESRAGSFLKDKVTYVDADKKVLSLQSGIKISYDCASFNIGSEVSFEVLPNRDAQDIFTVKPIYNLLLARRRILELARDGKVRIAVVGGGPAGLEVAANAWEACRQHGGHGCSIRLYSGRKFLRRNSERVRNLARTAMEKRGIRIVEGCRVQKVSGKNVILEDGSISPEDVIFLAPGIKPPSLFLESGLPTGPDGGLRVNRFLQCVNHPELFGSGDCIFFQEAPLDKVGVYAVRQSPVLFNNLLARLLGKPLKTFSPGGKYLLAYNLGGGRGIAHRGRLAFDGRLAFWIKNYLDTKFMKKFQL